MTKLKHVIKALNERLGMEKPVDDSELLSRIEQFMTERKSISNSRNNSVALQRLEASLSASGASQTEANQMILGLIGLAIEQREKIDALKERLDIPVEKPESAAPELKAILAKLESPREWTFKVIREADDLIKEIRVTQGKSKASSDPLTFDGVS